MKIDKILNLFIIVFLVIILGFLYTIICINSETKTDNKLEVNNIVTNSIENKINTWEYSFATSEDICKLYFYQFIDNLAYYTEEAYEILDEEYRQKRFGSIENFKQYVKENKERIEDATLDKYQVTKTDDYTQYVCIDKNENYYIIRETASMQYTVMLDTYTINLQEFTEKYNSSDEQNKIGMNIQKIIEALNVKDYIYIYNKLADEFKEKNFVSEELFEEYAKQTFYEKNIIEYGDFEVQGKTYIYNITIRNASDKNQHIQKNIIMQLEEGTEFKMSFNK